MLVHVWYISIFLSLFSSHLQCNLPEMPIQAKKDSEWEIVDEAAIDRDLEKDYLFIKRPLDCTGLSTGTQKIILGYLYNWRFKRDMVCDPEEKLKKIEFSRYRPELFVISRIPDTLRIKLYNIGLAQTIFTIECKLKQSKPVKTAISNDSRYLALGFDDGVIDIIDMASNKKQSIQAGGAIKSLCFSDVDHAILGVCRTNSVLFKDQAQADFWDWNNNLCIRAYDPALGQLHAIRDTAQFLLIKVAFYGVRVYKFAQKIEEIFNYSGALPTVSDSVEIAQFRREIAKSKRENRMGMLLLDKPFIYQAAVSNNGHYLAINCATSIKIFDIAQNKCMPAADQPQQNKLGDLKNKLIAEFTLGVCDFVVDMQFSPDSNLLVLGFLDKTLKVWDISKNTLYTPDNAGFDMVTASSFSEDGKYLITAINQDEGESSFLSVYKNQALALANSVVIERPDRSRTQCAEFSGATANKESRKNERYSQAIQAAIPLTGSNFRCAIFGQPDLSREYW